MTDQASAPQPPPRAPIKMASLIDALDWSTSPLGPREGWSESLRVTTSMMLNAHAEIVLFWGPEFVALYNDAYAPTIGDKHPRALGRPARENWAELWNDLEPLLRGVRETGETYSAKDRPFYIERHGYGETVYFDISYSAVPDPDGTVGGVLCIVAETTERVLAERRLRDSETRFRALVNAASDAVYQMSPDWRKVRQLARDGLFADVTARKFDWMDDFLFEEDRAQVEAQLDEAVRRREPFYLEYRIRRPDGTPGWTFSRAVPILDSQGELIEWFGAATDITERKHADEHLRLVVNELNHRVKNNLAMVQSIAVQTFRNSDDLAQAKERFSARLIALAHANDLLTGERWTGASLRSAITQAVAPHCHDGARLTIDGPDITVSSKTALALTLGMHELATNAVKYGAWSNDNGRVDVFWGVAADEAGAQQRLKIEWRELAGPPVEPPGRRGFGSRLIERGLAGEMNGEVALTFEPDGVRCRIDALLVREAKD